MLQQNANPGLSSGKTNSKVRIQKDKTNNNSGTATDPSKIQKAAELQETTSNPDYSSMETEIEKISDPVSFDELKSFYDLD